MRENGIDICPVDYSGIRPGGKLIKKDRERLEQKLKRLLEWVGAWIPEEVTINEKKLPLHEIIWSIVKKKKLTEEDIDFILALEEKLNKKYRQDLENIEYRDTTTDQAIRDYCEAIGLLRAIITLKDIEKKAEQKEDKEEFAVKIREHTKNQARQWMEFLRQVSE